MSPVIRCNWGSFSSSKRSFKLLSGWLLGSERSECKHQNRHIGGIWRVDDRGFSTCGKYSFSLNKPYQYSDLDMVPANVIQATRRLVYSLNIDVRPSWKLNTTIANFNPIQRDRLNSRENHTFGIHGRVRNIFTPVFRVVEVIGSFSSFALPLALLRIPVLHFW